MRMTDPSNRDVILPLAWQPTSNAAALGLHDYQLVIETPAGIIRTADDHLYYFGSIGKRSTVLLEVARGEEGWEVVDCLTNPGADTISSLLEKGQFTPGVLL